MRYSYILVAGALLCAPGIYGTVIETTSGNLSGGDPFSAEAQLTFGTNTIQITLTNLITDQNDAGQNLNGISFNVPGTFGTLGVTSFSSTDRSGILVNTPGGWTDVADSTNHWFFTQSANVFDLTTIGNPAARYTIIGGPKTSKNEYTNANSSIEAGIVHEPFLAVSATWLLSAPGITAADEAAITGVSFSFGTQTNEGGAQTGIRQDPAVPEPFSLGLVGSGLLLIGGLRRKFARH
jgi:hypothetical protein